MWRVSFRLVGSVAPVITIAALCCLMTITVAAQEPVEQTRPASPAEELSPAAPRVDVKPLARDDEIRARLQSVLAATDWFIEPEVRVEQGVVFLSGQVETQERKQWAGDLARNTQDVVAVANGIVVPERSIWDFSDAWSGMISLWREMVRGLPFMVLGLLILLLSIVFGMIATRTARAFLLTRVQARLLRNVLATCVGAITILIGVYIVLRVSGLTQLALTVVGGTGLIGLILGIAFRDITENFLASIFLSMQQPFEMGDLIEVAGVTGFVQQLNVRTTILMTLNGNVVQIPNAAVYKSNLRNFTTNANMREDFTVTISNNDSITTAQEIARKVLEDHPAILNDPEPWVLVDSLGPATGIAPATVTLRIYFWLNGREHSGLKVRSAVMRLVKRALDKGLRSDPAKPSGSGLVGARAAEPPTAASNATSTKAEGGLVSEAAVIEEQARQVQPLQAAENLLPTAAEKKVPVDTSEK